MQALRLIPLLAGLGLILYPLLVSLGLDYWGVRSMAVVLLLLACARLAVSRWLGLPSGNAVWLVVAVVIVAAVTLATGSVIGLKAYPVVVNILMLALFAFSLWRPPSMIERFARLREPDLPAAAIPYTRKVTMVWCGFFVVNGVIASATVFASDQVWAVYNGLVAYGLMGLLFAGEYLVRRRIRQQ
jgi:uncharacterized membrane protein